VPEDLIWRFAGKLEFGKDTHKVAEDAVRMVQRMSLDWMVMGRRPSGVCGACLILAARMNNYRRSITEVVYIVKVTTHTIQKRLDEFKMTPSSALTVDEFLNNEFLESAHDPPSFYEKTEEFQKNKKRRKRKRRGHDGVEGAGEDDDEPESVDGEDESNKRQRTENSPNPDNPVPTVELRRDADGFAIPPPPSQLQLSSQPGQPTNVPIDPDMIDDIIQDNDIIMDEAGTSFRRLVDQFGDVGALQPEEEQDEISTLTGQNRGRQIHVPREWARAEQQLAEQMTEMVSDPGTMEHAIAYAEAEKRVARHMAVAMITQRGLPFDETAETIGEDEFANDQEVQNFILGPEEAAKKEKMWINENKSWLRLQQIKEYKKKQEANGPPKAKRNRKKKPRMGEGQTSAASSPAEAVAQVMKDRKFSSKFNYRAFEEMFESSDAGLGSAATSRAGSRAPSDAGGSTPASTAASVPATPVANEDSEMGDADDYVDPDDFVDPEAEGSVQDEGEDWRKQLKDTTNLDEDEEDETEYPDLGFGDDRDPFADEDGAFDGPEGFDDE
jgi:transcription factor IIIB subunit 2